ncbi:MAG: hypothetical protein JWR84_1598 [Caulobacter sp.]|nr:hypothetical protein [Caulobacter sp.]
MIRRRLAPALLVVLLLAAPAAAQSSDPTRVMLATLDLCLNVLRGTATWDTGLDGLGYIRQSGGGRVQAVGGSVIAAGMGTNTVRGSQARLCEITATPQMPGSTAIRQGLASRAGTLPAMPASGPLADGSIMDGYADLSRTGLLVLAVTDHPAAGGHSASTSISVIWK